LDRMTSLAATIAAQPERINPYVGAFLLGGVRLLVAWDPPEFFNAVDEGRLRVALELPGRRQGSGRLVPNQSRQVTKYLFDVTRVSHATLWRSERGNDPPLSNEALAEVAMHRLVDAVEKARGSG